jgi:tetratricopeptide (TPR) repeat protein
MHPQQVAATTVTQFPGWVFDLISSKTFIRVTGYESERRRQPVPRFPDASWLATSANGNQFFTSPGVDPRELDRLLGDAAQAVLHKTQPYILASYLYHTNKDGALAVVNWIIATFAASDEQVSRAHYLKGRITDYLGRRDEATAEFKAAIALNRKFAYPHNGLGTVPNELGRRDEAIAEFKAAIAAGRNPPEAVALANRRLPTLDFRALTLRSGLRSGAHC